MQILFATISVIACALTWWRVYKMVKNDEEARRSIRGPRRH